MNLKGRSVLRDYCLRSLTWSRLILSCLNLDFCLWLRLFFIVRRILERWVEWTYSTNINGSLAIRRTKRHVLGS